ncbi:extracellular solute-binding protein [Chthonobacter rhizosphaerae]|uniref:extracellular solute-binding protein n=1 Tax=Chthonobacter rhizosphaerae TaxID=2735553 RepID=UPI001FEC3F1F|nr:extracellular solute-binding protein [Chthonobacter rhizosphaerae]
MTVLAFAAGLTAARAEPAHGIAMHGEPALPATFTHLPYANPDAPKGGRLALGFTGTFDSLNPFIVKGNAPRGLTDALYGNNVWDTLLMRSADEPFTLYGLVAETVDVPDDRSYVEFHLRPNARFSDGKPLTVEDVIFTVDLLKTKGRPIYRNRFGKVASIERVGETGIRFVFGDGADRELPLLIGLTPILPAHATDPATFDQSTQTPLVGSGPYVIESVTPGARVLLKRNPDYWAKDLPIKRGLDNFDEISIEYFRDGNAWFEAFKTGAFDVVMETDPQRWATGYAFPAAASGKIVMEEVPNGTPKGMSAFVMNTRKPLFQDPRVREAMTYLFDFEWINRNLYNGAYARTGSYFQGSALSALGLPASDAETALLAPFPDAVIPPVLDGTYAPPKTDGSGRDRAMLKKALGLFGEAGWTLKDGVLTDAAGAPFRFEFMAKSREEERLALAWQPSLKLVGIDMVIRTVDSSQYYDRQKTYDFDMIQMLWTASLSPGNEQNNRWSSAAATTEGTFNYAGVADPAADAMIDAMLAARERPDFEAAVRALDRVLMSGRYVVPLFHLPKDHVARWARIARPETVPLTGLQPVTWWAAVP